MLKGLKSDVLMKNSIIDRYRNIIETGCRSELAEKHIHDGYEILDVRPNCEVNHIYPRGSTHVEFSSSNEDGLISVSIPNPDFVGKVKDAGISREDRILVACGDGPLSFIACKKLRDAGFYNAKWLIGGLAGVPEQVLINDGYEAGDAPNDEYANPIRRKAQRAIRTINNIKSRAPKCKVLDEQNDNLEGHKFITIESDLAGLVDNVIIRVLLDQIKSVSGY
eukprot:CAMPEP_0185269934 /NCGR_PEP_ID=MMETSP1359-20130426/41104_1 /TAXON_ID=552665 /ORGANISM="Bigelowiella longifila, Strain CCMP242" /LENGTH=221 /DNA_ID=CAMNT_0027861313 /DNA_START=319 /DNA_END=984 /DNA_ORIENTATION=+